MPFAPIEFDKEDFILMPRLLLSVHLVFVGLWLGCVLTEVLFERALLNQGRTLELALVKLHKRVDLFVEMPAFVIVLFTGITMASTVTPNPMLQTKIGLGLLAIVTNLYCVWLVFRRAQAATTGQWDRFSYLDQLQHKFGTIVLLGILSALSIGIYLYAST